MQDYCPKFFLLSIGLNDWENQTNLNYQNVHVIDEKIFQKSLTVSSKREKNNVTAGAKIERVIFFNFLSNIVLVCFNRTLMWQIWCKSVETRMRNASGKRHYQFFLFHFCKNGIIIRSVTYGPNCQIIGHSISPPIINVLLCRRSVRPTKTVFNVVQGRRGSSLWESWVRSRWLSITWRFLAHNKQQDIYKYKKIATFHAD